MDAAEFEAKWYNQIVLPRGNYFKIPMKVYMVTAALYEYEENKDTILAVVSEEYNPPDNIEWFTIKISPEDLEEALADFEILS